MGTVMRATIGEGPAEPDRQRQGRYCSQPGTAWTLTPPPLLLRVGQAFTVIHDCVLECSCDMDQMMKDIRRHHADIYLGHPLWRSDEQGVDIPDGPIKGDLDLEEGNDSPTSLLMTDNLTLDLITSHVEDGNYEEAEQLAAIGEFEDCSTGAEPLSRNG